MRFSDIYQNPLFAPWRRRFNVWVSRRISREGNTQVLTGRSIYIIPTRYGFILAALLFALLLGAMNYGNSMVFMLTFLVTSIAVLGMNYTYGNLVRLSVTPGQSGSVFAGEQADIVLLVTSNDGRPRYGLILGDRGEQQAAGSADADMSPLRYTTPVLRRGLYQLPRTRIWTTFPFGLFYSWSWLKLEVSVIVYPEPKALVEHMPSAGEDYSAEAAEVRGDDDFSGIRRYQQTDSPNRIAWKAMAHSQEWLSKEFQGTASNEYWLDYERLESLSKEDRLSQLCQWVLDCERDHRSYGLRLPNASIAPDLGERQKKRCLEALALFEAGTGND